MNHILKVLKIIVVVQFLFFAAKATSSNVWVVLVGYSNLCWCAFIYAYYKAQSEGKDFFS